MSIPDLPILAQLLVNGALLGGVYLLLAVGLNLIFGVLRVLNMAHGEILMLGGFTAFWAYRLGGLNPIVTLLLAGPAFFAVGYVIFHVLLRPLLRGVRPLEDSSLLVTFGLGLLLTAFARYAWSADYRSVPFVQGSLKAAGLALPYSQLYSFGLAVALTLGLLAFLKTTRIGMQIRATAQNRELAASCGVDAQHVYAVAFGLGTVCAAAAGMLLSAMFAVYPDMGMQYSTRAFLIVVLGGMGSMGGALVGAMVLGVAETLGAFVLGSVIAIGIPFVMIIAFLWLRPGGLSLRAR